ncbi:hypothetical protein SAMN02745221_01958 [Thermosyntropha lipolytica DSM 11003]|uniref:CRISPR type III-B/RAMP module-associated protein Cmr5 n=1 Tax=Thermosyntropha lipolytica DSM 11003 TaxID=1123382 RepID=A0A1M5R8N6_9FIRM|nr:hypothetical protein [Thermosyntropha lipolytica]SHH22193.1 hypothetical protein SAMN02745221_01958 [Thermosyntropha lipolytica DSM 11003]
MANNSLDAGFRGDIEAVVNKTAFNIVKDNILDSNRINKLLGVLANDGVYAMWVYAKGEKQIDEGKLMEGLHEVLQIVDPGCNTDYERFFHEVSKNINNLLFLRELLEKVLIYARYHAKAK